MALPAIQFIALEGIPEIQAGADLAALIADSLRGGDIGLTDSDVLVVTQKVVSKAEGRVVDLETVVPREEARAWGERWAKDPRQVELVLRESVEIVRWADGGLIIGRTRHGFVCANAGVDLSNVGGGEAATLLPEDPDKSARVLRERLGHLLGALPAVVISDTFGRPWRNGIVNVAIGAAGLEPLVDLRGTPDVQGRVMRSTVIAVADELASAADLAGGKVEQRPVVLVHGYRYPPAEGGGPGAAALVMDPSRDLFP
jgi:coenzyme F420-0:L-glutamate ligase / coenzyme F420-1:gamma-L-glutamate ligase